MSKGYNAPAEVRELEKQINDFSYRNGLDVKTVFQDLLRYIIHGFSLPDTPPLTDWRYNKEQTKVFYDMFATWIQIMSHQIKRHGWYDALGDLFMALTSQSGQQQKGQFFTPAHITDLMSKLQWASKNRMPKSYRCATLRQAAAGRCWRPRPTVLKAIWSHGTSTTPAA